MTTSIRRQTATSSGGRPTGQPGYPRGWTPSLAPPLGDVEAELGEVWADLKAARQSTSEAGKVLSVAEKARLAQQLDDVVAAALAARQLVTGGAKEC